MLGDEARTLPPPLPPNPLPRNDAPFGVIAPPPCGAAGPFQLYPAEETEPVSASWHGAGR